MRVITPQELIKAFRKINKYGKSEISADTYIKHLCITEDRMSLVNRNLAIAELVSRLAPDGQKDKWYIAGLLNDICTMALPGGVYNPRTVISLMQKAHMNAGLIFTIANFSQTGDPQTWSPLAAALNFAVTHVDENGDLYTTNECCSLGTSGKNCNACMYARYHLSQQNKEAEAERIIEDIRSEVEQHMEVHEQENGRAGHEDDQRRMEKRDAQANAVYAG